MVDQRQLRGHSGPVLDQVIKLGEQEITLGRDLANDVVIPDSEVSRIHAHLSWQDDRHIIRDHKSTNGTWINGRPVLAPTALSLGDLLTLGKASVFVYEPVPQSELDTSREEGDAEELLTSTMAMPVPSEAALEARQVVKARGPRPVLPEAVAVAEKPLSPGVAFHQKYVTYLHTGDLHLLLSQYHNDATLLSPHKGVTGIDRIREYFEQYVEGAESLEVRATGKYVEAADSILCETSVETANAIARVQDVFVLRDGKATHHFTCTLESAPKTGR